MFVAVDMCDLADDRKANMVECRSIGRHDCGISTAGSAQTTDPTTGRIYSDPLSLREASVGCQASRRESICRLAKLAERLVDGHNHTTLNLRVVGS